MKVNITEDVATVLRGADITGNNVILRGTLDRKLYANVNDVLVAAGGKWNTRAKAHVFAVDPRGVLGLALDSGSIVDKVKEKKKTLQTFYTPAEVARKAVYLLAPTGQDRILEPSSGMGAMLDALVDAGINMGKVQCFDIDADACAFVRIKHAAAAVRTADFLSVEPGEQFDRIIMNPPFAKGQDIAHVTHAFKFLKAGGRLVAIMSPSWQRADNKAAKAFLSLVADNDGRAIDLPAGSFKESGTSIATVMLVIDR